MQDDRAYNKLGTSLEVLPEAKGLKGVMNETCDIVA